MTSDRTISLNLPVDEQFLKDVLTTAVEGGIDYWAACSNLTRSEDLSVVQVELTPAEEPDEFEKATVTIDTVALGIQRVLSYGFNVSPGNVKHIMEAIHTDDAGCIDAMDADVIIQAGVLGEIVYG